MGQSEGATHGTANAGKGSPAVSRPLLFRVTAVFPCPNLHLWSVLVQVPYRSHSALHGVKYNHNWPISP